MTYFAVQNGQVSGNKIKSSSISMKELIPWSYLLPSLAKTNKDTTTRPRGLIQTCTLSGGDVQHPKMSRLVTTRPAMLTPATTA
jgi:hypothetical protein